MEATPENNKLISGLLRLIQQKEIAFAGIRRAMWENKPDSSVVVKTIYN